MRSTSVGRIVACMFFLGASIAAAGPLLTLSSSSDLTRLTVGDTFTVDVNLGGLAPGDELQLLSAGIDVSSPIFTQPTSLRAGMLVSTLQDSSLFETSVDAGIVDAILDVPGDNAQDRVKTDGRFFSFDVGVARSGSATIAFDFTDALKFSAADPTRPTDFDIAAGAALAVSAGGATPIPLPAGWSSGLLVMGLIGLSYRMRGLRAGCTVG